LYVQGVLDKFSQIQPSLLFSVNAVIYNGKVHNHLDKLQQVVEGEIHISVPISSSIIRSDHKLD